MNSYLLTQHNQNKRDADTKPNGGHALYVQMSTPDSDIGVVFFFTAWFTE